MKTTTWSRGTRVRRTGPGTLGMRRWRGLVVACALAGFGLSCTGSTTEPEPITTLVAVAVDGAPLPATVVNWPDFHLELLADTVRFTGATYTQRRIERFTGIIGVPEVRDTGTDGSVRIDGRQITLEPFCDALFCVDIVIVPDGERYLGSWSPVEGVDVEIDYRRLEDLEEAGS